MTFTYYIWIPIPISIFAILMGIFAVFAVFSVVKYIVGFYTGAG